VLSDVHLAFLAITCLLRPWKWMLCFRRKPRRPFKPENVTRIPSIFFGVKSHNGPWPPHSRRL